MNWLLRLSETYDNCSEAIGKIEKKKIKNKEVALTPLLPICHTMQNAHIEVTLDEAGTFLSAKVVDKDDAPTLIPCTESSESRSGKMPINHPFADKLQYVAGDFADFGGVVTSGFKNAKEPFESFLSELEQWVSYSPNTKLSAVLAFLRQRSLMSKLIALEIFPTCKVGNAVCVLNKWTGSREEKPKIFSVLPQNGTPFDSFVRWKVDVRDNLLSDCSSDPELWASWIEYYLKHCRSGELNRYFGKKIMNSSERRVCIGNYSGGELHSAICFINGKNMPIGRLHNSGIRNSADGSKLISGNDSSGFTFRGKFLNDFESASIGLETSQKAHNALRWLIARQGRRFGDLNIVTWATIGELPPDPFKSSFDLFIVPSSVADEESDSDLLDDKPQKKKAKKSKTPIVVYSAKQCADKLNSMLSGYAGKFSDDDANQVVIMAIDSATPGRMAIRYYRELKGSEFLDRVREWHESCAWYQYFGVNKQFVGAPAPRDIAQAAYGKKLDTKDKLLGATVSRLLPCIMEAAPIPRDLVESCVRRASQRISKEFWEWSKSLGIACSLFRHQYKERKYTMEYETDRNTRDYLYGSLLAIAEHIEERALHLAKEKRDTHAAKLMQRFAERPFSTWRTIELQLTPSISRLRNNRPTVHQRLKSLLDETYSRFEKGEDVQDHPLSGEFLIGYHTLRKKLWEDAKKKKDADIVEIEESLNEEAES